MADNRSLACMTLSVSMFLVALTLCGRGVAEAELPAGGVQDRENGISIEPQILEEIRRIVGNIRVSYGADSKTAPLDLLKGPLLQNEFQYIFVRGSLWAWGGPGRPQAVLSLSLAGRADNPQWCHEMASLSAKPIMATTRGNVWWSAQEAGWNPKPVPDAQGVADTPEQRITQMRQLAGQFSGYTYYKDPKNTVVLTLRDEPVLHYGASGNTVDGTVFAFVGGRSDPEILLVIEAERDAQGNLIWEFDAAPLSSNALIIKHHDKQVWFRPQVGLYGTKATDTYRIYFASAKEEILGREAEGKK